MKNLAKLCTSFLFFAPCANAAAWLVDEGNLKTISEVSYYSANNFFDENGKISQMPSYKKLEVSNLFEYGYNSKLTIGAKPFFAYIDNKSQAHQEPNISLLELFTRHKIYAKNKGIFSLENKISLPGFYNEQKNTINGNVISTNNKDADFEISLNYGQSTLVNNTPSFYNLQLAYGNNAQGFFDDRENPYLKTELTFGYEFLPNWLVIPKILINFSLYQQNNAQIYSLNQKNYSLIKPQFGIVKKLNKQIALEASIYKDIWGQNTSSGNGVLISIWKDF